MYKKTLILVILAVLFAVCTAGCVSNDDPQITPGPSEEIPEGESLSDFSLTPGEVDEWPSDLYQVRVTANRDARTPEISVVYSGGAGTDWLKKIDVTLYREEDGATITQSFGAKPKIGDELTFTGSSVKGMKDRIKAVAYYDTQISLIISDQLYEYQKTSWGY